jgi:peptidoglycan hydrolase-like protein with peptidoglycan-binding domain
MPITLEQFKQAFAETTSGDPLKNRDQRFTEALQRLQRVIQVVAQANGPARGLQDALEAIKTRYKDARREVVRQAADAGLLDEVLRQTEFLIGRAQTAVVATNTAGGVPVEKRPLETTTAPEPAGAKGAGDAGSASQHASQLLQRGARGPAVKFLQEQLNQRGAGLGADGDFGAATQAAVKKFQQKQGLQVDGIVGPKTWGALGVGGARVTKPDAAVQESRDVPVQKGDVEQGGSGVGPTPKVPKGGVSADPAQNGGKSVAPTNQKQGPGVDVAPTSGPPIGPVSLPDVTAPVRAGDAVDERKDRPVDVKAPGFWTRRLSFNASGKLIVNGSTVSESNFPQGNSGKVELSAGQSGQVQIAVTIQETERLPVPIVGKVLQGGLYRQEFSVTWDVSADALGKLTVEEGDSPSVRGPSGGGDIRLESVNPSKGRAHVQVSPKVVGSSAESGVTILIVGETRADPAGFIQESFRLNIKVVGAPKPKLEPTRIKKTHVVKFERVGQKEVSANEEKELLKWYDTELSEAARKSVEAGENLVDVTGFASTTDAPKKNREIAEARASNVVDILKSYASSRINANFRGKGENKAKTADNVEDPEERRVEVTIEDILETLP